MLWLILGVILLVAAIAGGAIVHPILFVLGLVALFMFLSGWRRATETPRRSGEGAGASPLRHPIEKARR